MFLTGTCSFHDVDFVYFPLTHVQSFKAELWGSYKTTLSGVIPTLQALNTCLGYLKG